MGEAGFCLYAFLQDLVDDGDDSVLLRPDLPTE
jgi:hypothetical protein